jgi:hypothetical protein
MEAFWVNTHLYAQINVLIFSFQLLVMNREYIGFIGIFVIAIVFIVSVGSIPVSVRGSVSLPITASVIVNPSVYTIGLKAGYNLFTPILRPVDTATDRGIALRQGWNLFGFSSDAQLDWDNAQVDNGTDVKSVNDAAHAGWVQYKIYYFDENQQRYFFTPDDASQLQEAKGYFLYALVDGLTLELPGVGGSLIGNSFFWENAEVTDGITVMNITEAENAGWVQKTLYYYDENQQAYDLVPQDDQDIHSWRGYWLISSNDYDLLIGS